MERPVCVVHLYVRTFGMRRACEIVRCTLMWREIQTCIHEVCMVRHLQRCVHSKSQPSFFFLNCSGAIRLFSNQFRRVTKHRRFSGPTPGPAGWGGAAPPCGRSIARWATTADARGARRATRSAPARRPASPGGLDISAQRASAARH